MYENDENSGIHYFQKFGSTRLTYVEFYPEVRIENVTWNAACCKQFRDSLRDVNINVTIYKEWPPTKCRCKMSSFCFYWSQVRLSQRKHTLNSSLYLVKRKKTRMKMFKGYKLQPFYDPEITSKKSCLWNFILWVSFWIQWLTTIDQW